MAYDQKMKPARNILLSVKLEDGSYVKCKHGMGLFPNPDAGPMFRGTLKEQYLVEVHDFLGRAIKKGLSVRLAEFGPYEEKKEEPPKTDRDEWGDDGKGGPHGDSGVPDSSPF